MNWNDDQFSQFAEKDKQSPEESLKMADILESHMSRNEILSKVINDGIELQGTEELEECDESEPVEFIVDYVGEVFKKLLTQVDDMVEADILPPYEDVRTMDDKTAFVLESVEDLQQYVENKSIMEAVFVKSTHLTFASDESDDT